MILYCQAQVCRASIIHIIQISHLYHTESPLPIAAPNMGTRGFHQLNHSGSLKLEKWD